MMGLITLANVEVPANLSHLLAHLVENTKLLAVEPVDDSHLCIDAREVLAGLQHRRNDWQNCVPDSVGRLIVEKKLLGYDSR